MSKIAIKKVSDFFWNEEINPFNRQIIEEFLEQQEDLSPKSVKQYRSALKIFAKWIHDNCRPRQNQDYVNIVDLEERDALRYQNWMLKNGLSPNAIKLKRSAVSSLCKYIEVYYRRDYPYFRNIFTSVKPVKKSNVKEKIPLTKEEYDKLCKELEIRQQWQKLAYLKYTFATGCRREESRQLKKEVATYEKHKDKNGLEKNYYITHPIRAKGAGKTGKIRRFSFDEEAMIAIRKWLEIRGHDNCDFLFVSKYQGETRQLNESTFNAWCEQFSEILGKKVHPHLIRATRATIAVVDDGKDIKSVQALLGHESSQTTEIYVVRDATDDLDELF